ncbi:Aste57867_2606 [Aphanomyces stellatus]|uniref:Aste57867_2606 protein n=1 Tax=Aphanomyces stellatus TaxID=120398 RepID=A0A485KC65_9STRA|nr:hypothetical protein As57867_002599 [Aphanomyces stellatus]VFT79802.1 Aste57867_2606 [Aphanomyces stellatus]
MPQSGEVFSSYEFVRLIASYQDGWHQDWLVFLPFRHFESTLRQSYVDQDRLALITATAARVSPWLDHLPSVARLPRLLASVPALHGPLLHSVVYSGQVALLGHFTLPHDDDSVFFLLSSLGFGGSIAMAKRLAERYDVTDAIEYAAIVGHLALVEYLAPTCSPDAAARAFLNAATNNHEAMLRFLLTLWGAQRCGVGAIAPLVEHNRMEMVRLVLSHLPAARGDDVASHWRREFLDAAVYFGRAEMVALLLLEGEEYMPVTKWSIQRAVLCGHLDALQLVYAQNVPESVRAQFQNEWKATWTRGLPIASKFGWLPMLEWFVVTQPPTSNDDMETLRVALDEATKANQDHVVEWLRGHFSELSTDLDFD